MGESCIDGKVLILNLMIFKERNMHSTTPKISFKTIPPLCTAMGSRRCQTNGKHKLLDRNMDVAHI